MLKPIVISARPLKIVSLLLLSVWLLQVQKVAAASPTPAASPTTRVSPSPSPKTTSVSPTPVASADPGVTTQNLKQRIEKIVEEKRDQIEGVLDEISGRKKGFIGEVQRVSSETVTLKTNKGTQILGLSNQVSLTKGGNPIEVEGIAVGDWAIAIGMMEDDEFQPERLVISSQTLRPPAQVISLGSIETLTKTTITVAPRSGAGNETFNFVKATKYQDLNGDVIKQNQIQAEQPVLVVGVVGQNGNDARVVRLLSPVVTPTPTPRTNAR